MSYPGYSFGGGGSYPSAEMQSVYSTALAYWAAKFKEPKLSYLSKVVFITFPNVKF